MCLCDQSVFWSHGVSLISTLNLKVILNNMNFQDYFSFFHFPNKWNRKRVVLSLKMLCKGNLALPIASYQTVFIHYFTNVLLFSKHLNVVVYE